MPPTVLHMCGAEGHVAGGSQVANSDPVRTNSSSVSGTIDRQYHWPREGNYTYHGNVNTVGIFSNNAITGEQADGYFDSPFGIGANGYVSWSMEFSSVTPTAISTILTITQIGSPYFQNYTFRIISGGNWEWRSASTLKQTLTVAQLGLRVGVRHWFLMHFGTGRIRMWIGEDNPNAPGTLLDPTKWDENAPVFDYTDATQTGSFGYVSIGPVQILFAIPNVDVYWDSIVYCSDAEKPTRPILPILLPCTGDGVYSGTGALRGWVNEDNTTATYDRIDDPIERPHDGTTTYIKTVPNTAGWNTFSAVHATVATIIKPEDTILAVMSCAAAAIDNVASASNCENGLTNHGTSRYGEVIWGTIEWTSNCGQTPTNTWGTPWYLTNTDFDGNPWTIDTVDDAEWCVQFENYVGTNDIWACTWGALYVAYQKAIPVTATPRSRAQAQVI